MITASTAWELADTTNGHFVLGLGTQVKAHIERRYSTDYAPPGPRLKEYVLAIKAIFSAFRRTDKLDFQGDFYNFDLLPAQWSPGPIDAEDPQIYVSAVLPWMSAMAGEVCDGVHIHPFHSTEYLRETQIPNIESGAAAAGRTLGDIALVCPVMTAVGDTDEELHATREHARTMIAFYGSTRTYSPVFEQHGFEGLSDKLHKCQREGDFAGMTALITDDVLENYIVSGSWSQLGERLVERYRNLAPSIRIMSYTASGQYGRDPEIYDRWAEVTSAVADA